MSREAKKTVLMTHCVDMHIHSTASDGSYSPAELVDLAKQAGVCHMAITDHDSVAGVRSAYERGREIGVEVLYGIELTSAYEGMLIDILGYLLDIDAPWFVDFLDDVYQKRMERAEMMVSRLVQAGYPLSWDQVLDISKDGFVCGVHILHALYNNGFLQDFQEVWGRLGEFFGREGPAYVPSNMEFRSAGEVIRMIHDLGGVAVIAHPGRYQRQVNIRDLVYRYKLDGLEAFYSTYTAEQSRYYQQMARGLSIVTTGGSDFHGLYSKGDYRIGSVAMPEDTVLQLSRYWIKRSKTKNFAP